MDKKEIVELFKNFNLGDYESKTYSALIFLGPSKVSDISRESKVPQSKIYEVLEKLMVKELVEVYGVRPKEFKAVHPNIALKTLLEDKEKQVVDLKQKIGAFSQFLNQNKSEAEVMQGIWTAKESGWKSFQNRVSEMEDKSKKYVYVVTRDFSWSSRLAESVKSCHKRNVEIKAICIRDIDDSLYQRAKWFYDHGLKIRVFKTEVHPRIIDSDGKEILMRLDTNPTKKDNFDFTSIWSRDVSLVKVIDTYVKSLWGMAKPVEFKKLSNKKSIEKPVDYGEESE
jgi:sugar-specific transcriptional regulator TrmB